MAGEARGSGEGGPGIGFAVVGVDHVTITTPEELEEQVVDWYQSCLGLSPIEKPPGTTPGGAWLKAGNQEIHVQVDAHNPPKLPHFALVVDSFDEVVERLRHAGCHIEQARSIPGRRRCLTRDPAGNGIEIVAFEETAAEVEYAEYVEEAEH